MPGRSRDTSMQAAAGMGSSTGSGSVAEWLACWTQAQKARVQIAVATVSDNSFRQTVHTHCASVYQAAKLAAALLMVAALSDTAIPPSVCPMAQLPRRVATLAYKHIDCLQLNNVRTADLSADRRRSAASRTAIGGRHIVSPL